MNLVPIYLNPLAYFDAAPGTDRVMGIVMAPTGSRVVSGARGNLLAVPTPDGLVQLSAGDVAEQASVGGCGLSWATRRPEAWRGVRAATPRKGGVA